MNLLRWLNKWYISNCSDEWEHLYGVKIYTLDNPGWSVKIDLLGTDMEDISFDEISIYNSESDWIICRVKEDVFDGGGVGSYDLEAIIKIFYNWVTINSSNPESLR